MRPPIDGGAVLVTGASSGIGREIARQLAPRAGALVLTARRTERLEALWTELSPAYPRLRIHVLPCDLSDPQRVESLADTLPDAVGEVDVVVNNAGVGHHGLYERSDWEVVRRMLHVNVTAPALLTRRLLPGMVARGRGGILNIGSGAGFAVMPGAAAYVGTKHFLNGFSETLRLELAGTGVVVTQVCPGPVETEFGAAAGVDPEDRTFPAFLRISAEQCAREALRGFERGRAVVFPGQPYRLLMGLQAFLPRSLWRRGLEPSVRRMRKAAARGEETG